jgi:predicted RNA-binding Zn-ribbon protein involved in translation (DUF1610 family)
MSRYPRSVRSAHLKCIPCNAPVVETIDGGFHCVDCGGSPIRRNAVGSNRGDSESPTSAD